ncbi:hypothetical protein [Streptomyces roseoverticillatus]|uniref:hypothetical protein n=1 Tax=Streptomyces roseoverticillatus TaxID=66429 RepID=UPI0004C0672C|nr:hypothetical protein [Streptomyces roseoverticillatus]
MSTQPWTIERIHDALGNPTLAQRFLSEINKAPAHDVLAVFAKWQGIADRTLASVQRGREAAAAQESGGDVPGQWTDVTDRVLREADRIQARGAA